jgi:hypothetical protein
MKRLKLRKDTLLNLSHANAQSVVAGTYSLGPQESCHCVTEIAASCEAQVCNPPSAACTGGACGTNGCTQAYSCAGTCLSDGQFICNSVNGYCEV